MASYNAGASLAPLRGLVDGLGQRVVTRTASGTRFEALRLSAAFAGGTRFEREVRETLASIARFSHPAFPPSPRIERLSTSDGRPVLVSPYEPGLRLVTLLRQAQRASRTFTTSTVLFIVRDTLQALRAAHCAIPGYFHGALGPERIVVTPDLRVLVVEHVLGRGLAATLPADPAELWRRFGIAVPADPALPPFGPETDQLQIGLIALALLLGRPLDRDEYPDRIAELTDEARETDLLGRPSPLGATLREWLSRLLFISTNGPYSDLEAAENDLAILLSDEGGYVAAPIGLEVEPEVLEELPVHAPARASSPTEPPGQTPQAETPTAPPQLRLVEPEPQPELDQPVAVAGPAETVEYPLAASAALPSASDGPLQPGPSGIVLQFETPPAAVARGMDVAQVDAAPAPATPIPEPLEHVEPPVFHGRHESEEREPLSPRPEQEVRDAFGSVHVSDPEDGPPPLPPSADIDTAATPAEPPGMPRLPLPVGRPHTSLADHATLQVAVGPGFAAAGDPPGDPPESPVPSAAAGVEGPIDPPARRQVPGRPRGRRVPARLLIVVTVAVALLTAAAVAGGYYLLAGMGPPGRLRLESAPVGAAVLLEGRRLGRTPLSVQLPPGLHYVQVQGQYSSYTLAVQIRSRGEVRERVSLPEAGTAATLVVRTEPAGLMVTVDGQARGNSPLTLDAVPPGRHQIAAADEVSKVEREVVLAPAGRVDVTLAVSGWIAVESPLPVRTLVDGRPVGAKGPIGAAPGRHRVEFVNEGLGLRDAQDVIVEAGRTTSVVVSGTTGGLDVTADIPADVFIDGQPAGRTPLVNLALPLGKHEVRFSNPRLGDVRYEIAIRPGTNSLHGTFGAAPAQRPPSPRRIR